MKTNSIIVLLTLIILGGFLLLKNPQETNLKKTSLLQGTKIIVYKSPTCGCCGDYISYLKSQGAKVQVETTTKLNDVKSQYGVPTLLESCHTSIIDNYVIEGHVPAEAIRKLLDEKPLIAGIALPEMPAGSPGMGGVKLEPFNIHQITLGGEDAGVFMEL